MFKYTIEAWNDIKDAAKPKDSKSTEFNVASLLFGLPILAGSIIVDIVLMIYKKVRK